jgi:malate dehydrogenase (oxaloacetate-decarboxylating)
MAMAAAQALAAYAEERGMTEDTILPRMDEWEVFPRIAVATALKAQEQGVARVARSSEELYAEAWRIMGQAREATEVLMRAGLIQPPPEA